jgi:hypothetical protein
MTGRLRKDDVDKKQSMKKRKKTSKKQLARYKKEKTLEKGVIITLETPS